MDSSPPVNRRVKWKDSAFMNEPDPTQHNNKHFNPFSIRRNFSPVLGYRGKLEQELDWTSDVWDTWQYTTDNAFAKDFLAASQKTLVDLRQGPCQQICTDCGELLRFNRHVTLAELQSGSENCKLCEMLLHATEQHITKQHETDSTILNVIRVGSALKLGKDGPRILRLCSDEEVDDDDGIQLGIPRIPTAQSSEATTKMILAWLQRCDDVKSHRDCKKQTYEHDSDNTSEDSDDSSYINKNIRSTRLYQSGVPPARLIDVDCGEENKVKICSSRDVGEERYVALSHCWGRLEPKTKAKFSITTKNLSLRHQGFTIDPEAKTFLDAVTLTRRLGIKYLWIDALCIIQDDAEDWAREAPRMEHIFSGAYCTIAVTSAADTLEGFLKQYDHQSSRYIQLEYRPGKRMFVCDDVEDFDLHVIRSGLNNRAWVLQERILSRRTVHFSKSHIYWECGDYILCDTFTKLESPKRRQYYFMDPRFPRRMLGSSYKFTCEFIQYLFESYSRLGITKDSDRAVAISGLEDRLAWVLGEEKQHGWLKRFGPRLLLWGKGSADEEMKKISYPSTSGRKVTIPSWSWMAYSGPIRFLKVPYTGFEWIRGLRHTKSGAICIESAQLLDCRDVVEKWPDYNEDNRAAGASLMLVVLGRDLENLEDGYKFYGLLVRPRSQSSGIKISGEKIEYERFGVGIAQAEYVSRVESIIIT